MQSPNKTAVILRAIAAKNVITQSEIVASPRLLQLFLDSTTTTPKRRLIDTISLLSKKGYLSCGILDGEKVYKITIKGENQLDRSSLREDLIDRTRFNGRYYIISFEVPESRKVTRNALINCLKLHGFYNYQKGLWLLPYNPAKLIEVIKDQFELNNSIKLIVAIHIDDEAKIKRHFNL